MPFTIEFRNAETNAVAGGVSYLTREDCRRAYRSIGHSQDKPPRWYAELQNESGNFVEEKPVDEFDVKIMLGLDEL